MLLFQPRWLLKILRIDCEKIWRYWKWASQEGIDAYRIYDADLPDYNAAIDRYGDYIVVQEYAAPKSIPEPCSRNGGYWIWYRQRSPLRGSLEAVLLWKCGNVQKGTISIRNWPSKESFGCPWVWCRVAGNLRDYLDTGLFLDHRLTRRMIGQLANNKRFLNLFAYTGSATVHAALGGARFTTTVDMSRTYLNWAKDNLRCQPIMPSMIESE